MEPDLQRITGNQAMPGFTAPKLLWLRNNEPRIFSKISTVLLPKDYLRFKLCGEMISDMSDSAGTLWMDTAARDWSERMLSAAGLSREQMPKLVEGSEAGGSLRSKLASEWGISTRPVIAVNSGDNAAGAVGIGALSRGRLLFPLALRECISW